MDIGYKKILILGNSLHQKDATGITLSNLFSGWPKEKIIMVSSFHDALLTAKEGYPFVYSLGRDETRHYFPLNLIKRKYYSGPINRENSRLFQSTTIKNISNIEKQLKLLPSIKSKYLITRLIEGLLHFFGFYHFVDRCILSKNLANWIEKNNPDFIYTLLSTRASILMATNVQKKLNKPIVIHIMDDWPSTIVKPGILENKWKIKIDKEFRELLKISFKRIAISKAMAKEFEMRYSNSWEYYHNPVKIKDWIQFQVKALTSTPKENLRIAYFGRVGKANEASIIKFIDVINNYELNTNFEFHLFSSVQLNGSDKVFINEYVDYKSIPYTISKFDLLLLPLSFSEEDIKFARYSIPTKMSEYLFTGIPVILFAPEDTALTEFFKEYECGFRINSFDSNTIIECLNSIKKDWSKASLYSINAKRVAFEKFDLQKVTKRFQSIFIDDEKILCRSLKSS